MSNYYGLLVMKYTGISLKPTKEGLVFPNQVQVVRSISLKCSLKAHNGLVEVFTVKLQ